MSQLKKLVRRMARLPGVRGFISRVDTRRVLRQQASRAAGLRWEPLPPVHTPRYDAGGAVIGDELFLIAGYVDIDHVVNWIDVFDLRRHRWTGRVDTPVDMAQSHLAVIADGRRFVYIMSGQSGPRCAPSVPVGYAFDARERRFSPLPPLPEARYAATMQLWRGRLHVFGGSHQDRVTPATEHWSLAVADGRALGTQWRAEPSIPRGGPHRASAVVADRLYALGGQEGDFRPRPGCPDFKCQDVQECVYADCFRLDHGAAQWRRLPDMPVAVSHTECATFVVDDRIVIVGGESDCDPRTFTLSLTDAIQVFDTESESWEIVGRLPYRLKTGIVAWHDGWLYVTVGQRDRGPDDDAPGRIEEKTWRARLPLSPPPDIAGG